MLKELLNNKYVPHTSSGKFSISSVGGCFRKKYLELKGEYKEDFNEDTKRILNVGNIYHNKIIGEIIEKGNVSDLHIVASEFNIPIHPFLSGRIDAVLSDGINLYIIDIKSAGKFTMDKIKQGICPENYQDQIQLYMHLTGILNGILLFVGKTDGQVEEFEVKYNKARALSLIEKIGDFMGTCVAKNILPDKCNGKPFGCKVCFPDGLTYKEIKEAKVTGII